MSRTDRTRADLLALFQDPPAEYGDFATWFWETGSLTRERITWQLERMKAAGVSGTWYYPRYVGTEPLATDPPYWSDEWREIFNHSVAEHRRLGMKAGFSDWTGRGYWQDRLRAESRARPELAGQRLVCHEATAAGGGPVVEVIVPEAESVISASAFPVAGSAGDDLDGDSRIDLSDHFAGDTLTWSAPSGTWRVIVVSSERHDLDYLNPAVVTRWLQLYSEVHERELGDLFGETLDVFLHDELWMLRGNIIYSQALVDRIRADYGYDPLPEIAALFRDIGPRTDKIRCDYYEAMAILLEEHFYRPFSVWHEERGLRFATVATWGRQSVLGQTYHYVDYFRYLRHFHITGNEDPLGADPGNRCLIDAKMSSSIEHIYRRERSAVCAYWRSGWGMTQDQNIAWTHENFAYGINLYNGHGGLYGSMGGWYEWEPPLIYFRQPYTRHWPAVVSHVSRLSAVMSQGTHCADVALLYPLTTVHAQWRRGEHFTSLAYEAGNECFALAQHIYRSGIDFNFVDDHSLAGAEIGDGVIIIAGIAFRCVVVPPMTTIKTSTLETLKRFYEAGGTVIGYRRLPTASQENGRGDPQVRELVQAIFRVAPDRVYAHVAGKRAMDQLPIYSQALDSVHVNRNERGGSAIYLPVMQMHGTPYNQGPRVAAMIERSIDVDVRCSAADVYHTHRYTLAAGRRTDIYFLFNQSNERREVDVTFRCAGEPELWDPATGSTRALLRWRPASRGTTVRLDMQRYAGLIVVFDAEDGAACSPGSSLRVSDDNLDELIRLDGAGSDVVVEGLADSGGLKQVAVTAGADRTRFRGAREVEAPPAPLTVGGEWRLTLIPTLDNRWGDFRLPATGLIGPEARRFRYREEQDTAGTDLGWHTAGFDDSHWQDYLYSEGPFAYSLGPFRPGSEPAELENGAVRLDAEHIVDGRTCRWQPFAFSPRYGHRHSTPGDPDRRSFEGVPGGVHRLPTERRGWVRRRRARALPAGPGRRARGRRVGPAHRRRRRRSRRRAAQRQGARAVDRPRRTPQGDREPDCRAERAAAQARSRGRAPDSHVRRPPGSGGGSGRHRGPPAAGPALVPAGRRAGLGRARGGPTTCGLAPLRGSSRHQGNAAPRAGRRCAGVGRRHGSRHRCGTGDAGRAGEVRRTGGGAAPAAPRPLCRRGDARAGGVHLRAVDGRVGGLERSGARQLLGRSGVPDQLPAGTASSRYRNRTRPRAGPTPRRRSPSTGTGSGSFCERPVGCASPNRPVSVTTSSRSRCTTRWPTTSASGSRRPPTLRRSSRAAG